MTEPAGIRPDWRPSPALRWTAQGLEQLWVCHSTHREQWRLVQTVWEQLADADA